MTGRGSAGASLTPTEHSVAGLVAEGLSNPQIGARMYISSRTVQTHLAHIFAKLDISSRAQLAAEVTRRQRDEAVSAARLSGWLHGQPRWARGRDSGGGAEGWLPRSAESLCWVMKTCSRPGRSGASRTSRIR